MVSQVSSGYYLIWLWGKFVDDCVYYKFNESKYVFLILYVDTTVAKGDKFSLK